MPECLRPFWDEMMSGLFGATTIRAWPSVPPAGDELFAVLEHVRPILDALEGAFPDPQERVLVVLEWYGQGAGTWSSFPAYESYAENLLLAHSTEVIVAVLEERLLTPAQLEGAARYLAGWQFYHHRPDDRTKVPKTVRTRLLKHVLPSGDADKIERAEAAFGNL